MTIYTSDKAVPYVYICVHKETDQFYIGYREKNVRLNRPSHLDLPKYKTSSTTVRPDWENYNWTIVAEFFDPSDAYTFEQQLIYDNWKNPLLLNGHYNLGERKFRPIGPSPLKGKPSPLKGIPNGRKGVPNGRKGIPSPIKGKPGKPHSTKANQKKSERMTGKPSGRKGIPNGKQQNPSKNPSPKKGIPTGPNGRKGIPTGPNGRKGIPTGPNGRKGIPSPLKGKPSGPRGKQQNPSKNPSPKKGIPSGKKGEPSKKKGKTYGKQKNPSNKPTLLHPGLSHILGQPAQ
jgi:hypothetical protein